MLIMLYHQVILPLGIIALVLGSYLTYTGGRRRRRSEQTVEEEFVDRATVALNTQIYDFAQKYYLKY